MLLMFMLTLVATSPAFGQWRDITKWEVSPFVGYETGGSYPVNNSFIIDRLRVDGGLSFGTFIDYSLTENSQAEFMWSRYNTSFIERDAAIHTYTTAFNSTFTNFSLGFLYIFTPINRD